MSKNFVKILELQGDRLEVCVSVFYCIPQIVHARYNLKSLLPTEERYGYPYVSRLVTFNTFKIYLLYNTL